MNTRQIVSNIRTDFYKRINQRIKYNAYADQASVYSATKNNLYNIQVKEAVKWIMKNLII